MPGKRDIELALSDVDDFDRPRPELEQYRTPADVAAHVVHLAAMHGDVADRTVVDLGTGTGMFALGASLAGAARVVGLDRDPDAIRQARGNETRLRENETRLSPPTPVDWLVADAARAPLCPDEPVTVLSNPPFGAHRGREHADRAFLETAAEVAAVSYTVHNADSEAFVRSFAADAGGRVTDAFRAELDLPAQFDHHERERETLDAEVFRVEWHGE